MKRILPLLLVLSLGACAQVNSLIGLATTAVTPTEAIIAANAFDAAESGATGFLTYCKANMTNVICSAGNRRSVIKFVRAGRQARNQVETYVQTSTSIPAAVYNALITATSNIKATPAGTFVGAK